MPVLATSRLRLEPYTDAHASGLNALNADPEVMHYISGRPETLAETFASIARVKQRWIDLGYSWWCFIEHASGEIVGAGAVQNLRRHLAAEPDPSCPLELGWRLRPDRWHQGLASEAAQVMADFAFDALSANALYAVCDPDNTASAKVMQRLGMQYDGLQTWYDKDLTTYVITRAQWQRRGAGPLPSGPASPRLTRSP